MSKVKFNLKHLVFNKQAGGDGGKEKTPSDEIGRNFTRNQTQQRTLSLPG